jgi:hypothetical protein
VRALGFQMLTRSVRVLALITTATNFVSKNIQGQCDMRKYVQCFSAFVVKQDRKTCDSLLSLDTNCYY